MATNNVINANSTTPLVVADGGTGANTLTIHGLLKGDAAGAVSSLAAATNGQLPIGSTAADPVLNTITAGSGITVTNGAGTITIAAAGAGGITTLDGDTGSATGSTVTIAGGSNISTSATAATVTLNLVSSPSVSGSVTAGSGVIVLSANVNIVAGNLDLPITNSALNQGAISLAGVPVIQFYGTDGATFPNIFIGEGSGNGTLSAGGGAQDNVGIGTQTLKALTTGGGNAALGHLSLIELMSGNNNVALGYQCGFSLTTGNHNASIGQQAMLFVTGGSYNTILGGYQAAVNYTSNETSNILIQNPGVTGENNVIRIGTQGTGNAQQSSCYIAGIAGSTVNNSAAVLIDTTSGELGTIVSSQRFKKNITDMADRSSKAMNLRPVNFSYKEDASNSMQFGLIAEEVAEVMPEIVTYDASGVPYTVRYHEMPAILLNELQKLSKRVSELELLLQEMGE